MPSRRKVFSKTRGHALVSTRRKLGALSRAKCLERKLQQSKQISLTCGNPSTTSENEAGSAEIKMNRSKRTAIQIRTGQKCAEGWKISRSYWFLKKIRKRDRLGSVLLCCRSAPPSFLPLPFFSWLCARVHMSTAMLHSLALRVQFSIVCYI